MYVRPSGRHVAVTQCEPKSAQPQHDRRKTHDTIVTPSASPLAPTGANPAADALHQLLELAHGNPLAEGAAIIDLDPTVRDAVNTARNAGVSYLDIGDALDIRRGNAYSVTATAHPPGKPRALVITREHTCSIPRPYGPSTP